MDCTVVYDFVICADLCRGIRFGSAASVELADAFYLRAAHDHLLASPGAVGPELDSVWWLAWTPFAFLGAPDAPALGPYDPRRTGKVPPGDAWTLRSFRAARRNKASSLKRRSNLKPWSDERPPPVGQRSA